MLIRNIFMIKISYFKLNNKQKIIQIYMMYTYIYYDSV